MNTELLNKDYQVDLIENQIIDQQLSDELILILDEYGIKQKDFSRAIGWQPDNLSQRINGRRTWKAEHILRMCEVLGIMLVMDGEAMEVRNKENIEYQKEDMYSIPANPNINKYIGRVLFQFIKGQHITIYKFAEMMECSLNQISSQVRGIRKISATQVQQICATLNAYCVFDGGTGGTNNNGTNKNGTMAFYKL